MTRWFLGLVILASSSMPLQAGASALMEALEEYYLFAEPGGGSISYSRIPVEERSQVLFVDTRAPQEYQADHIPGALQIEWREILERRDELPLDRPIILYCNSGASSAQAMMGLRLAGMENVRTLAGGFVRYLEKRAVVASLAHEAREAGPEDINE